MELRAVVTTNRQKGLATLQWMELLSSSRETLRATDWEFDPEEDEYWEEEVTIPEYGRVVGPTVERPIREFYDHKGSLTEWVESWLPKPLS